MRVSDARTEERSTVIENGTCIKNSVGSLTCEHPERTVDVVRVRLRAAMSLNKLRQREM